MQTKSRIVFSEDKVSIGSNAGHEVFTTLGWGLWFARGHLDPGFQRHDSASSDGSRGHADRVRACKDTDHGIPKDPHEKLMVDIVTTGTRLSGATENWEGTLKMWNNPFVR